MYINALIFIMVPIYTFYLFFQVIKADMVRQYNSSFSQIHNSVSQEGFLQRSESLFIKTEHIEFQDALKKDLLYHSMALSKSELQNSRINDWQKQQAQQP